MAATIYTDNLEPEKKSGNGFRKTLIWLSLVGLLILGGWIWYKYYFVFGTGVKSGYLNYAVYKGNIFKTYEGKLIQQGFSAGSGRNTQIGGVQSNEFEFSIENEQIFKQLEGASGRYVDLHYKEYHAALPWRGNTRYVVDEVRNMK
ncbi:hypothetical protein SAMN05443429_10555 [Cruoricaptor ignavus]|uniref:6-phosphogluconate dehydrogenase n=1 Tax=Cruoricaptor ignavus TaxID=1118202 RepID=A0A1M6EBT2_9FLAO|nr:hypothetical protein [Cruoricaptor ignavus]SHI82935.1 hypothetical protein SAMN05443429_10555 [Cruoricaptor ignavus]